VSKQIHRNGGSAFILSILSGIESIKACLHLMTILAKLAAFQCHWPDFTNARYASVFP
jgi:hypothetical protein